MISRTLNKTEKEKYAYYIIFKSFRRILQTQKGKIHIYIDDIDCKLW